jgi:hypothetical protein
MTDVSGHELLATHDCVRPGCTGDSAGVATFPGLCRDCIRAEMSRRASIRSDRTAGGGREIRRRKIYGDLSASAAALFDAARDADRAAAAARDAIRLAHAKRDAALAARAKVRELALKLAEAAT